MPNPPQKLGVAWRKLLTDCVAAAIELGATDPQIFFERHLRARGLDGPICDENCHFRKHAIVFTLPWPTAVTCDAGGF